MLEEIKQQARRLLRARCLVPPEHPVFIADACDWYKSTPEQIRACVSYIEDNFRKHRIPFVRYPFVLPYDGWPFHKRRGSWLNRGANRLAVRRGFPA